MPVPMVGELTVLQYLLNSPTRHLTIRLAKNALPAEIRPMVLADLVESTFDGYAAIVDPVFDPLAIGDEGLAEGICGPLVWTAGPAIVAEPITAVYGVLTDVGAVPGLFFVERVSPWVSMQIAGQQFAKRIRMLVSNRAT